MDLIQPVLNCSKLEDVAKVFVLNHCRGFQNFNLAQKVWFDGNGYLNGSDTNSCHLLDDCLFYYSTAPGNPAVRNTSGSLYFKACFNIVTSFMPSILHGPLNPQSIIRTFSIFIIWKHTKQFAVALNESAVTDDSNDLGLRIKQFFNRKTFQSKINGIDQQFYIAPYTENHLKLKLYFPTKLFWITQCQNMICIPYNLWITYDALGAKSWTFPR